MGNQTTREETVTLSKTMVQLIKWGIGILLSVCTTLLTIVGYHYNKNLDSIASDVSSLDDKYNKMQVVVVRIADRLNIPVDDLMAIAINENSTTNFSIPQNTTNNEKLQP